MFSSTSRYSRRAADMMGTPTRFRLRKTERNSQVAISTVFFDTAGTLAAGVYHVRHAAHTMLFSEASPSWRWMEVLQATRHDVRIFLGVDLSLEDRQHRPLYGGQL